MVNYKLLAAILIMSLSFLAQGQLPTYKTYSNARFGYSISYPSNLLTPQGESTNGDGQKFRSGDGSAELIVYGSNNALDRTLRGLYGEARTANDSNFKVTYEILKPNWFVVSGIDNGKVFYQKTLLKQGVIKTFRMEYDEAVKQKWDPITTKIAQSFEG
jgi:hypothetical protein